MILATHLLARKLKTLEPGFAEALNRRSVLFIRESNAAAQRHACSVKHYRFLPPPPLAPRMLARIC